MSNNEFPGLSKLKWLGIAMLVLGVIAILAPMVAGTAVVRGARIAGARCASCV